MSPRKGMLLALGAVLFAGCAALGSGRLDLPAQGEWPDTPAVWPAAGSASGVQFSVLRTAESKASREAWLVAGGRWSVQRRLVYSAVLIRHPRGGTLLFDTGLGRRVDDQFKSLSALSRAFLGYEAGTPAADQLKSQGIVPSAIVLSHLHWDHASGLPDFPGIEVWVPPAERDQARRDGLPAFIASQFEGVRWGELRFTAPPYMGFEASHDWFGDGSVVLVPLSGHTAGQVGLFLNLASGQRYFFIGDTTWTLEGVQGPAERPWLTRTLTGVDHDDAQVRRAIVQIHRLWQRHPTLVVVPAHDENVAQTLPRFPQFSP